MDDGAGDEVSKDLLEQYGTRLQATKAVVATSAKRVAHDREEFRRLQAVLRHRVYTGSKNNNSSNATSTNGAVSDAWLKQNMVPLLQKHVKAMETRRQQQQAQAAAAATTNSGMASPTSVMQFVSPFDANNGAETGSVIMEKAVSSPPLFAAPAVSS